jgi:hypothetical protein
MQYEWDEDDAYGCSSAWFLELKRTSNAPPDAASGPDRVKGRYCNNLAWKSLWMIELTLSQKRHIEVCK